MISQFSPKVSQILAFSREEAARLASKSVGPEHLLLGILRDKAGPVHDLLLQLDIDFRTIKGELETRVREDEPERPFNTHELVLNDRASRILKMSVLEARVQSRQMVDESHLLLAILHDSASNGAKEILEMNNMNYEDTLAFFQQRQTIYRTGWTFPMRKTMTTAALRQQAATVTSASSLLQRALRASRGAPPCSTSLA